MRLRRHDEPCFTFCALFVGGGDGRGGRLQQAGTSGVTGASPPMPFSDIVDWLLEHGRSSVVDVRFGTREATGGCGC